MKRKKNCLELVEHVKEYKTSVQHHFQTKQQDILKNLELFLFYVPRFFFFSW